MFEHGECIVKGVDDIIFVKLKGSFNELAVKSCITKIKNEIVRNKLSRFSMLVDYTDSYGGTPEAYSISNDFNKWLNSKNNLFRKALVTKSNVLTEISLKQQAELRKQNVKVFNSRDEALSWLRA